DSTRFSASMIWLSVNLDFFILQNSLNEKILLLITPVLRGDYPGIQLAKNQYAYRTATVEAKGTVPEMLKQILAKASGT
ncbi:hypothetical protein KTE57_29200, partial [Burkholderia multivorans]|nr:hypothetical protein [Burkholderia multivorans]